MPATSANATLRWVFDIDFHSFRESEGGYLASVLTGGIVLVDGDWVILRDPECPEFHGYEAIVTATEGGVAYLFVHDIQAS